VRFLSVCSGIEAASVAWHPLGWRAVALSEIDRFASATLAHHYPEVPNLGDMTRFGEWPDAAFDVLVGGTPCQSFSVAGLRRGMVDPRGNLALVYLALADRYRPRWLVWENVPGVLSSNRGRDFGAFLGALVELGYGFCYRVLDAQYFGLAMRRKLVFVVAHLGDWRPPARVLIEREGLRGDPAPRRETGQVAPTLPSRRTSGGGFGTDHDLDGGLIRVALRGEGFDASEDGTGRGTPPVPILSLCLNAGGMGRQDVETETLIPFDTAQITSATNRSRAEPGARRSPSTPRTDSPNSANYTDLSPAIKVGTSGTRRRASASARTLLSTTATSGNPPGVASAAGVRRLTPRECERLQGFPDDYTRVAVTIVRHRKACPAHGEVDVVPPDTIRAPCGCKARHKSAEQCPDGPRYKALGNSIAVPVLRWIGRRIAEAST
jgi:DNA (cytosine-5)-methyltransferase 1